MSSVACLRARVIRGFLVGILVVLFASPALAAKKSSGPKPLKPSQAKRMAKAAVQAFFSDEFFKGWELPERASMGLVELKATGNLVTSRGFTDAVLDQILQRPLFVIMNQEIGMSLSQTVQLESYDEKNTARYHASLLGAHYYIVGKVKEHEVQDKKGKIKRQYVVELFLNDVTTDSTKVHTKLNFKDSGALIKLKSAKTKKKKRGRR